MVYSGREIEARIGREIIIDPYNPAQLNPNSYNLRLHDRLLTYTASPLDMKKDNPTTEIVIPPEGLQLEPGRLYLGRTVEYTETHNAVPMLEGRSSVGRLGLFIHVTAGFGDVGFCGYWTLEIFCVQPIVVYPGVEICQIYFHQVSPDHIEYRSDKYQNNRAIQASMLWRDFTGRPSGAPLAGSLDATSAPASPEDDGRRLSDPSSSSPPDPPSGSRLSDPPGGRPHDPPSGDLTDDGGDSSGEA